jgi:hypothetical protein
VWRNAAHSRLAAAVYSGDQPGVLPNFNRDYSWVRGVQFALGRGLSLLIIVVVAFSHLQDAVPRPKMKAVAGHKARTTLMAIASSYVASVFGRRMRLSGSSRRRAAHARRYSATA